MKATVNDRAREAATSKVLQPHTRTRHATLLVIQGSYRGRELLVYQHRCLGA
jgi:hypothetical protein